MYRFKTSITVATLAAAAEADYTITETRAGAAKVGDCIVVTPAAAPETGLVVLAAWVDSPGVIKVRLGNVNAAAALAGGATDFYIAVVR